MESFHLLINEARKAFDTADHLTYVTYPIVKESKLIITITEHIHQAITKAVQALLEYERLYKRISFIPDDFITKMEMLKRSILPRYKLQHYSPFILELRGIMANRKKGNVEIVKENRYYIYSSGYNRVNTISLDSIKSYLIQTKGFLNGVSVIIAKND